MQAIPVAPIAMTRIMHSDEQRLGNCAKPRITIILRLTLGVAVSCLRTYRRHYGRGVVSEDGDIRARRSSILARASKGAWRTRPGGCLVDSYLSILPIDE
jgi:hypothetical protein